MPSNPVRNLPPFIIISLVMLSCAHETRQEILQRKMTDKNLLDLIEELRSDNLDNRIRAANRLGLMSDAALSAIPALEDTMLDPLPEVRVAASRAYWRLSGSLLQTLPVLHDALEFDRTGSLETLREIGLPAVAPIIRALDDPEADIRRSAAMTLGWMTDLAENAIPKLKTVATSDPDPDVKSAESDALIAIRLDKATVSK